MALTPRIAASLLALLTASAAGALAAPAAPAHAVAPPTRIALTVSSSSVAYGSTVTIGAVASIPDGTPVAGRIDIALTGATGSVALASGHVSGATKVGTVLTPAPGVYTVTAHFSPDRAIDQTAADVSAPLRSYRTADLALAIPKVVSGSPSDLVATITSTSSTDAFGGTVHLEVAAQPDVATCAPVRVSATVARCVLRLPGTLAAGVLPMNASWYGSDVFREADATGTITVLPAPAPRAPGGSSTGSGAAGTSGSGAGSTSTADPTPSPTPSVSASSRASSPARAGADEPASERRVDATDSATTPPAPPLALIGAIAGALLLAAALLVLLLRRRARRAAPRA